MTNKQDKTVGEGALLAELQQTVDIVQKKNYKNAN